MSRSLALLSLLLLANCLAAADLVEDDLLEDRKGALLRASEAKDDKTGKFVIRFALQVPKEIPSGRQVGLFVCFHGHGGQAPHEARTAINALKRLKLLDDYIVIGAKSQAAGWETADHVPVTRLIEWAKATFPINPRRVYTHGMSSGGAYSGNYGSSHPEIIAASVIFGSGISAHSIPAVKDAGRTVTEFYTVMGLDDDEPHKNSSRRGCAKLKELGYRTIYREIKGLGHTSNHPPTNDDSILWATRLRHKTMPLADWEVAALRAVARPAKDAVVDQAAIDLVALVGGPQALPAIEKCFASKDAALRAMAARACGQALFGDDVVALLVKRLKDEDGEVRKAAFEALAINANWRYTGAQDGLSHVATSKRWDLAERLTAIDGLGFAVRFQVRGTYEDPPMFRTLVQCMEDDELEVRTRAFAPISTAIESGYDPAADKSARPSAMGKWKEWLAKITPAEGKEKIAGRK